MITCICVWNICIYTYIIYMESNLYPVRDGIKSRAVSTTAHFRRWSRHVRSLVDADKHKDLKVESFGLESVEDEEDERKHTSVDTFNLVEEIPPRIPPRPLSDYSFKGRNDMDSPIMVSPREEDVLEEGSFSLQGSSTTFKESNTQINTLENPFQEDLDNQNQHSIQENPFGDDSDDENPFKEGEDVVVSIV